MKNASVCRHVSKIENGTAKSVHPSTWSNLALTGLISMKFDVSTFFFSLSRKFKFH